MAAIPIFENPPREGVLELLAASGLPTADIDEASSARFYGAGAGGALGGVVAIEVYGECGLLRSLAVSADHRRTGIGRKLLKHAEGEARPSGRASSLFANGNGCGVFCGARLSRDGPGAGAARDRRDG